MYNILKYGQNYPNTIVSTEMLSTDIALMGTFCGQWVCSVATDLQTIEADTVGTVHTSLSASIVCRSVY